MFIDNGMMLEDERSNETMVDDMRATFLARCHQPDKEKAFDQPVEWQRMEKRISDVLDEAKRGVDNPVDQPFRIIVGDGWFNSQHARTIRTNMNCRARMPDVTYEA